MTNEKFERQQREKFEHVSLDKLRAELTSLNNLDFPHHHDYTLMDEIANEIDRREMSKRVTETKEQEMTERYNGWTNYETWRVNLEILDGMDCTDFGVRPNDDDVDESARILAEALESYCAEMVELDSKGFALDLALSFLNKVDWQEIAEHMMEDAVMEAGR